MKVTIRKIAELSGVSRGTVDRVLNNRPGVKPEIRDRVLKVALKLDYKPNIAARALAFNKNPVRFGVIMPPREITFFDEIRTGIKAAENELKDLGIKLEYRYVSNRDSQESIMALNDFVHTGISGIMFSGMENRQIIECIDKAADKGIPVVTFNSDVTVCKRLCFIGQDLYKSGRIAAGLMYRVAGRGSRIVAVTGNLEFQAHRARIDGFTQRACEKGMDIEVLKVIECFDRYEDTYKNLSSSLEEFDVVTGVYMAAGDIKACTDVLKSKGLEHDTYVICNDLLPETVENMKTDIIDFAITQNPFMQGYKPLKVLYEYVITGKKPESEFIYTDTGIVIPESL